MATPVTRVALEVQPHAGGELLQRLGLAGVHVNLRRSCSRPNCKGKLSKVAEDELGIERIGDAHVASQPATRSRGALFGCPYSYSAMPPHARGLLRACPRRRRACDAGAGRPGPGQPRRRASSARTRTRRVRTGIMAHAMSRDARTRHTWSGISPMAACRAGVVRRQGACGEVGDGIPGRAVALL